MTTIPGATSINYTLTSADVGQNITCTVIGTNIAGSANGTSNLLGPVTAAVSGSAPVNTGLPTISGTLAVDETIMATSGTWNNSPTLYAYQWMRGVPDVAPVNTVAPAITYTTLSVNSTLTLADGTWTGTPTPTYTRQWKSGTTNVGTGTNTYTLVAGDLGATISAVVTATNAAGAVPVNSNSVGPVTAAGDPNVDAWINAVVVAGGTVSGARSTAVTNFVTTLKSAGVWTTMDRYWLLAGENAGAFKIDIVAAAALVITGTPVLTANKGIVTSSGNNAVTDFVPSTAGGHFALNSATFGMFINNTRITGSGMVDCGAGNAAFDRVCIFSAYESTYVNAKINNGGSAFGNDHNHSVRGGWIVTRNAGDAVAVYFNASSAGYPNGGYTGTVAATGLPDCGFALGAVNQTGAGIAGFWSGDQLSSFYIASGWSPAQALAFHNAEQTLMTAIGVLP